MNQALRQAYLTLIESLLTCPSEEETAILQANLELLDDDFAQYLREWATETLPNLDADKAKTRAEILYNLNKTFSSLQQGSRRSNIEIAIACLDIGLTIFTREAYSEKWAIFQNSIANSYLYRIKGDRGENLERAIAFYEAALQVRTRADFPQDWAMTQNNLANAYSNRIQGDRSDNLERAEDAYELAFSVSSRYDFPENWAMTQYARGYSYLDRIRGDRQNNLEKAIVFFESALQVYTREDFPEDWARTQKSLGLAYLDRIRGDKKENLNTAITVFTKAFKIYNPTIYPFKSMEICRILGNLAFTESLWKKASYWYEKAIECVEEMRETETSESRKRKILEENIDVYEKMVQSCINCKQYDRALQTVDRSKSRYLVELFTNSEIYPKTAT